MLYTCGNVTMNPNDMYCNKESKVNLGCYRNSNPSSLFSLSFPTLASSDGIQHCFLHHLLVQRLAEM